MTAVQDTAAKDGATAPRGAQGSRGPWWANAMRWTGVVLLVLAVLFAYVDRTLLDPEGFADATVNALQNPAVANEVAQEVTDKIILEADQDLTAIRSLIVSTVEVVLTSEAAAGVVRFAATQAHALAFSEQGNTVLLNLKDLTLFVQTALKTISPEATEGLSAGGDISVEIPIAGDATDETLNFAEAASSARWLTWLLLVLGVGLLLAGILTANARRRAMLSAGVGLATGGVIIAVLVALGRLGASLSSGDRRGLVDALYQAYLGPLLGWGIALALIGVVLAAAAAALLDRVDVDAWLAGALRGVARTPISPVWRALRALALLVGGVLVVWHPVPTLTIVAVAGGVVLAFLGLRELLTMVAGPAPASRRLAEGEPAEGGAADVGTGGVPWRLAVMSVLGVALVGVGIMFLATRTPPAQASFTGACNGSEDLCDRRFDEVAMPGTHNSMAAADVPDWLFPNHRVNIPEQLNDGIRALLIDTHVGIPAGDAVITDLDAEPQAMEKYAEFVGEEGVEAALRVRNRVAGETTGTRQSTCATGSVSSDPSPWRRCSYRSARSW